MQPYPKSTLPVEQTWLLAQAPLFSKTTKSDFKVNFASNQIFFQRQRNSNHNIVQSSRQEKDWSTLYFPVSEGHLFPLDLECRLKYISWIYKMLYLFHQKCQGVVYRMTLSCSNRLKVTTAPSKDAKQNLWFYEAPIKVNQIRHFFRILTAKSMLKSSFAWT